MVVADQHASSQVGGDMKSGVSTVVDLGSRGPGFDFRIALLLSRQKSALDDSKVDRCCSHYRSRETMCCSRGSTHTVSGYHYTPHPRPSSSVPESP